MNAFLSLSMVCDLCLLLEIEEGARMRIFGCYGNNFLTRVWDGIFRLKREV